MSIPATNTLQRLVGRWLRRYGDGQCLNISAFEIYDLFNFGDLLSLQRHSSHQAFLVEDECVDAFLGGR